MCTCSDTCRVGFKPPATISQEQPTARYDGSAGVLAAKGRHDPCVVPRAVPIVETMAALVLMECVSPSKHRQNTENKLTRQNVFPSHSMLMQQNARVTAASLLPPLTHLPPTMVIPGKSTVQKIAKGEMDGELVQDNKPGDE